MECLADMLASHVQAGDTYCLYGDVGAGKSTFSRAFVRSACGDPQMPVPSPTFLLQQTYDGTDASGAPLALHHFDLYRLKTPQELQRLCIDACFAQAVCLVEWAERLAELASSPQTHLAVDVSIVARSEQAGQYEGVHAAPSGPGVGREEAQPEEEGADDEDEDNDDDEEEDEYSDKRWRRVVLRPVGQYWVDKVTRLRSYLEQCAPDELEGLQVVKL